MTFGDYTDFCAEFKAWEKFAGTAGKAMPIFMPDVCYRTLINGRYMVSAALDSVG
jgi:hypothetical protein